MNGYEQQEHDTSQSFAQDTPPPGAPNANTSAMLGGTPLINRKSPALATVLSLMPGLGQVYVGYYQQGFLFVVIAAATIAVLSSSPGSGMASFLGIFLAFFWTFNLIDANRRALHYNRVAAGLGGEAVPEGFAIPGTGGSIAGGVGLVIIGMLLFLNSKFDVSMEWLNEWWPLLLVAGGIWLIVKARQQKG